MTAPSYHRSIRAKPVVPGELEGLLLASDAPLSFWGGYDAATGAIIDRAHPLSGRIAAGRILAVPFTKGSSTTSAVLLEAVRAGTAPAALLTRGEDAFLALAAFVADELYRRSLPVLALDPDDFARLRTGQRATISTSGEIEIAGELDEEELFSHGEER